MSLLNGASILITGGTGSFGKAFLREVLDNHDPRSGANVLSRGIVGDLDGEIVVAEDADLMVRFGTGRYADVEHLLLVGGPNDVVVERNIQRGQRPLPESTLRPEPVAEPLPDPLAEAGRLPEPPRAIAEGAGGRTVPPFEMPVVVPSPVPGSMSAPPVRKVM